MARCRLRIGKARRIGARIGVGNRVRGGNVRGGEGHWVALYLDGGEVLMFHPASGERRLSRLKWFDEDRHAREQLARRFATFKEQRGDRTR